MIKNGDSMNNEMTILRVMAMSWWKDLSSAQKTRLCDLNTEIVGKVRRWETLTGREIENLYREESQND